MSDLHPRAKYRKGQKLITTKDYRSLVKMSLEAKVPKGTIVEVVETLHPDEMIDKTLIRCRNRDICKPFDFCVPEDILVPCTDIDRLLYG